MSKTKDTHKKSLSEALVNSIGSYPISLVIAITLLPACANWIQTDPLSAGAFITFTYSLVSLGRVYVLRRVFEKFGYDDNFLKLGIKLIQKISQKIRIRTSVKPTVYGGILNES